MRPCRARFYREVIEAAGSGGRLNAGGVLRLPCPPLGLDRCVSMPADYRVHASFAGAAAMYMGHLSALLALLQLDGWHRGVRCVEQRSYTNADSPRQCPPAILLARGVAENLSCLND